ncbi:MAG: S-layer homology domain-containing protein, partial [Eubacteriales bacterium]
WTVGDSEILELVDGTLTAKAQGTTWISVESPENPQWVTGFVPVTTVDLTTLSDWASETVTEYYLAQMLPISLCSDFQDGITRSELAVLVDELAKNTKGYESFTVDNPFADMSHLDVSTQYAILRCYVAGLMIGTDVDTFSPDDLVTREQAAVVLMRALANIQETHYDIQGEASFTDNDDISDWAVETVTIAQEQGVMVGDTAGNFNPQTTMTREEMIVACSSIYAQYNP